MGPPIYAPSPYYPQGWVPPPPPVPPPVGYPPSIIPPTQWNPLSVVPPVAGDQSSGTGSFAAPVPIKKPLEIIKEHLDRATSEVNRKSGKEAEGTTPEIVETKWEDIDPLLVLRGYQPEELSILKDAGSIPSMIR